MFSRERHLVVSVELLGTSAEEWFFGAVEETVQVSAVGMFSEYPSRSMVSWIWEL